MDKTTVGAAWASRWRWLVLTSIAVSYLLVFTQRTGPGVISDQLQSEFHVSAAVLGTITSIQYLLYMLLQIPVGLYGDKSGPERMLVCGVLCDGAGTLLFASAHSFGWLLAGRAIVGLGDALIWVNIVLILGKWFAKGRFAAVLGVVNTAGNLGALVTSIPLAAWIAAAGWHFPFTVIGALLLAAGVLDGLVLMGKGPAQAASAATTGSVRVQKVPIRRLLAGVVRDRLAWSTFCCHFGAMGTYLAMVSLWVVPFFMDVYRLSRAEAAWFTLIAFVGALVASPVMGWVSDRLKDRQRPYLATQTLAAASWLSVVLWRGEPPLTVSGAVMFIVGFGCGSSLLTFAAIRDHVCPERSGVTSGFANTGGFLSAVLLPVLFGAVMDAVGGGGQAELSATRHAYAAAFVLPTVFSLVGVFGSLLLPRASRVPSEVSKAI
ncbi:MFS transporter [Alicyclobacillus shizuokensis]|uniref:MFS transporter n=1 Tax=Alicyclobacillus shizuokensis TaxID=392014 RepID=UPI00082B0E26|nr:MFS transporter [Alicyclobacillus shizuokensis]